MRILSVLTYYRPHTSGLTIYAERLARALVGRGHQVTVLTSRFTPALPREEVEHGVRIVRVPVLFRVSKGVIMPTFGAIATRLVCQHQVIHLHLPQLDAAGVALRGRVLRRPPVVTYHCDLTLPPGLFNRVVNQVVHLMNHLAARAALRLVTYTADYAAGSPFLSRWADKVEVIPPPIELPEVTPAEVTRFAARCNPQGRRPVIGMAARLAAEKGVEVLLEALPAVLEQHPEATVVFAGQHQNVLGEVSYWQRLAPTLERLSSAGRWRFLGVLDPAEMAAFYPNLDVLVVPSLNATESFGMVQIEAMMRGTPVVASDLPGVRQPVQHTGMGRIAVVGDARSLAQALLEVLGDRKRFAGNPQGVAAAFTPDACARAYEALFESLLLEMGRGR